MDESQFINTLLKNDALKEESDPGRQGQSVGGRRFLNAFPKRDALREERDPL